MLLGMYVCQASACIARLGGKPFLAQPILTLFASQLHQLILPSLTKTSPSSILAAKPRAGISMCKLKLLGKVPRMLRKPTWQPQIPRKAKQALLTPRRLKGWNRFPQRKKLLVLKQVVAPP
jgi:hypothetical protein